jgi:hypothetical protein
MFLDKLLQIDSQIWDYQWTTIFTSSTRHPPPGCLCTAYLNIMQEQRWILSQHQKKLNYFCLQTNKSNRPLPLPLK